MAALVEVNDDSKPNKIAYLEAELAAARGEIADLKTRFDRACDVALDRKKEIAKLTESSAFKRGKLAGEIEARGEIEKLQGDAMWLTCQKGDLELKLQHAEDDIEKFRAFARAFKSLSENPLTNELRDKYAALGEV